MLLGGDREVPLVNLGYQMSEDEVNPPSVVRIDGKEMSTADLERINDAYTAMHRLASSQMNSEAQTVSMTPTVLVHEVYMRLTGQSNTMYQSKSHFLAIASTMMRRILVDHARSRSRTKRGGQYVRVNYEEELAVSTSKDSDVLALEEALVELAKLDSRQARVVEMRFFGGMTVPEVAEVLGVSTRTIENEWKLSRAWLRKRLDDAP